MLILCWNWMLENWLRATLEKTGLGTVPLGNDFHPQDCRTRVTHTHRQLQRQLPEPV